MGYIGNCFGKLEGWAGQFSMEVFSELLKPEDVREVLKRCHRETTRQRKLSSEVTVWLVVAMGFYRHLSIVNILNRLGNVMGLGSLWSSGKVPASSSAVEARDRLGFGVIKRFVEKLKIYLYEKYGQAMRWKEYLLLALDGSTLKVPDSAENQRRFGLPGASRGRAAFPQMRALFLVSTKLHFVMESMFCSYRRAEMTLAKRMLPKIPQMSLVLMDRNFNAWELLLGILNKGSQYLVRAKDNMHGKVIKAYGRGDRLVQMSIHRKLRRQNPWMPRYIQLREISALVQGKPYRFFTSLLDPVKYPAKELVQLYMQRWEEEIMIDEIKTHQCGATTVNRPVIFRCKTSRRVLQEAYGLVLAYNLIRAVMAESAQRYNIPVLKISFVASMERIRDAALLMAAAPTWKLPLIYEDLLYLISGCVLPDRRNRSCPRAVCVKMSTFPLKQKKAAA